MRSKRRRLAAAVGAVVASATLTGCFGVSPGPPPPGTFTGLGFDTCSAPSASTMFSWLNSPYRAVGVYIGGENRACSQPNLTPWWVGTVGGWGWRLMPIYVGLQAPCNGGFAVVSYDQTTAWLQGIGDADTAILKAGQIGLGPGTVIFNDMEAYNNSNPACSSSVITFLNGWSYELHARGFPSGVYSSAGSGMVDLVHQVGNPNFNLPNDIWFAAWPGSGATVWNEPRIPNSDWNFHSRIHQYSGGHTEGYGGVALNIDQDAADAVLPG